MNTMRTIRTIDFFLALFALVTVLLMASCAPAATATPAPVPVTPEVLAEPRLRIINAGDHDIHNLTVLLPNSRIFFGDVPAAATSN